MNLDLLFGNFKKAKLKLLAPQLQYLIQSKSNPKIGGIKQEERSKRGFESEYGEGAREEAFAEGEAGARSTEVDAEAEAAGPARVALPASRIRQQLCFQFRRGCLLGGGGARRRCPNPSPNLSSGREPRLCAR